MMEWRNVDKHRREILPMLWEHRDFILFDTETTGLKADSEIIQFSAVKYHANIDLTLTEMDMMDIYIKPSGKLPPKITEITGITEQVLNTAEPESVEAPKILKFLQSADMWAAYNKSFDLAKLYYMFQRTGLHYREKPTVDVLEMARDCVSKEDTGDHSLSQVYTYLFPDAPVSFHSSIEDVKAAAACMAYCLRYYKDYTPLKDRVQAYVEYASHNINPRKQSQQRIKVKLSVGDYGDIYWDIINKVWSCKKSASAKKLFNTLDLANIEQQVLNRYGWRYDARDMDTLSKNWGKAKREKKKAKEQAS